MLKKIQIFRHQLLEKGKNEKVFEWDLTGDDAKKVHIRVKLFYYPYIDSKETLPTAMQKDKDKDETPLEQREAGIEVFWNDRLIPQSHLKLNEFELFKCSSGTKHNKKKIQKKWISRVKGMMFVNEAFPVTSSSKLKKADFSNML